MSKLRRIVLIRHGETDGESSVRFHGSSDVALSEAGRAHLRAEGKQLADHVDALSTILALRPTD